jgi:hypothetical protein
MVPTTLIALSLLSNTLIVAEMVTTTKAFMKARSAALRLHSASDDLLDADHVNGSLIFLFFQYYFKLIHRKGQIDINLLFQAS